MHYQDIDDNRSNSDKWREEPDIMNDSLHKNARDNFIRKVYGIQSAQLCQTAVMICISVFSESYQKFLFTHMWIYFVAFVVLLITMYAIMCYESLARKVPTNYIQLTLYTVSFAYIAQVATALAPPAVVVQAGVLTAVITVSITIYAFTTTFDATVFAPCVLCFIFQPAIAVQFFLSFFLEKNSPMMILISSIFVQVYAFYLQVYTQMIIGKFGVQFSHDDYILAALCLFTEIMNLFLMLLEILQACNS